MDKNELKALETLVVDNALLDELEALIAEFNIFETMGAVRQELRHSDFLAFLLNPNDRHGLDDVFLQRFLIRVLSDAEAPPISPIRIKVSDLSKAVVERETQNIDILIHDDDSGIVCVIENKIYSGEHSDQLNRYLRIVKRRFPQASAIIPVFLTPDGIPPEDEKSPYIPFSYSRVADIMGQVRRIHESTLGADVNTMIRHYITMLRRHIVSDSDVAELCRQIYRKHKSAIDLIVEHMPDEQQELSDYLAGVVSEHDEFQIERHIKSYVDFTPNDWNTISEFNAGIGLGSHSKAVITFQFSIRKNSVRFYLMLGPVASENEYIREKIFAHAASNENLFQGRTATLSPKWTVLYSQKLLREKDIDGASVEELSQLLQPKIERLLSDTVPLIKESLMTIQFQVDGSR